MHTAKDNLNLRQAKITDITVESPTQKDLKIEITKDKTTFGTKNVIMKNITAGRHDDFKLKVYYKDSAT